jgi:hypothetical protein
MGFAWRILAGIAVPMAIAWFFARHALYWMFVVLYGLFGPQDAHHFGKAPPEAGIVGPETVLAWVAAYLVGALVLQNGLIWLGIRRIGQAENFSPTALYLLGGKLIGGIGLIAFPLTLVLFVPYLAFYLTLGLLRLVGVRRLLGAYIVSHTAEVVDISAGSPWRSMAPPRTPIA